MFATGSRTSPPPPSIRPGRPPQTERPQAAHRGEPTPHRSSCRRTAKSEHRGKAGPPARTKTATTLTQGGDTRALTLRRARLPRRHECAPVLAGVKVVRPVGRSTLTPAPGRQQDDHEGAALSVPTNTRRTGPTTGKDLTRRL